MSQTLRSRFEALNARRETCLTRAKEFAELSIPSLYPDDVYSEDSELPVPFSSATARGIMRLAARVAGVLIPLSNNPFFALELDDLDPIEGSDPTPEQVVLSRMERRIMRKLSTTNLRSILNTALQHLACLGNVLMVANQNYSYRLYRIDQYVVRRRPDGEWHELVIKEYVDPTMLPEELIRAGFTSEEAEAESYPTAKDDSDAIYTRVVNNHKGGCDIEREYEGRIYISGAEGHYDVCPYFPLRWTLVSGENYGRGLVEDNLGDIRAAEVMAEALLDSIAANAEYRFGVNPAGMTEIHDLQETENGAFVPAAPNDVFPIQLQNQAQVLAAQQSLSLKEATLGQVFLLNSAVQPQGERVTATQVRILATELEQALGGVFSDSARELLLPLVRRVMYQMLVDGILLPTTDPANAKMIEELKREDGLLGIKVKTGVEALFREIENDKMMQVMDRMATLPQPAQEAVIWPGMLNRWISTYGVEPTGIIKTVEQMQQQAQAAQQQAMMQAAQQQAIQSGGAIAEQAASQQGVSPQ